jgi:hypothetical protein
MAISLSDDIHAIITQAASPIVPGERDRFLSELVTEPSSPPAARGRPAVDENGEFLGSLTPSESYFLSSWPFDCVDPLE